MGHRTAAQEQGPASQDPHLSRKHIKKLQWKFCTWLDDMAAAYGVFMATPDEVLKTSAEAIRQQIAAFKRWMTRGQGLNGRLFGEFTDVGRRQDTKMG